MKNGMLKKLVSIVLAACMVLSMALCASAAVTKYYLKVEIKDSKESKTLTAQSGYVAKTAALTAELVEIIGAEMTADDEAKGTGMYKFNSRAMYGQLANGIKAFKGEGVQTWDAWTEANSANVTNGNTAATSIDLIAKLKNQSTTVGALTTNTAYSLKYVPVLPESKKSDPAYGNTYTFTITLCETSSGGGNVGGGSVGGGTTTTPTIPAGPVTTVDNMPDGSVIITETAADGSSKATTTTPDGSVATTTTTAKGEVTAVVDIVDGGGKVEIPMKNATAGTVAVIVHADGTEEVVANSILGDKGVIIALSDDATIKLVDNSKDFNDVGADDWFEDAVDFVSARGIMSGFNAAEFGPDTNLNRAMIAQIFYNMEKGEKVAGGSAFPDVAEGEWYSDAIAWAAAEGLVSGYGDGTYQPNKDITREELVQIFYNYAKYKGLAGDESADLKGFVDYHMISDWSKEAMSWGVGAELLGGKGGNTMDAQGGAVRAESAQMIMNFFLNIAN